jgi:transposase
MKNKAVAPFRLHMTERYPVALSDDQEASLRKLTTSGKNSARTFKRAMILLASDEGKTYTEIMEMLNVSRTMVRNTRKNFFLGGLDSALHEKPRPGQPVKITSEIEAKLTALACEDPPEGRESWTITLLQEQMIDRFSVKIGWGSIQRKLSDNSLKPWKKRCGASRK